MPLLRYDLTRAARRGRLPWIRALYGLALLGATYTAYERWNPGTVVTPALMAAFAADFCGRCAWVQLAAVAVLAPVLGGAALAEERQRGTLELLLMTGLRPGAIVRGKLFAHVAQLLGVLLVGVPIGAILLLLGGVDWRYPIGAFVLSGGLSASVTAVAIVCSARAKSVPAAVVTAYAVAGVLALVTFVMPAAWFVNPATFLASWPDTPPDVWFHGTFVCAGVHLAVTAVLIRVAAKLIVPGLDAGEYAVAQAVRMSLRANRRGFRPPPSEIAALFESAFNLLRQPAPSPVPTAKSLRAFPVPPILGDALVWKETHFGGNPTVGELVRSVGCLTVLIEFAVGFVFVTAMSLHYAGSLPADALRDIASMARGLTVLALSVTILSVAAFASGCLTRERESQTLDGLLTLPDGRWAVLRAKWLGSMLRGRWPAVAAAIALSFGAMVEAIDPLGALFLAASAVAHLSFCASLGLRVSVECGGTGRAVFLNGLFLLVLAIVPVIARDSIPADTPVWPPLRAMIREGALSPPVAWVNLAYRPDRRPTPEQLTGFLLAAVIYAAAAPLLYGVAQWRFRREAVTWRGSRP
ncbi:MAG: ABC transporter permease subunit [Gemmataceae bacterium]